jgi:hypothetical protein
MSTLRRICILSAVCLSGAFGLAFVPVVAQARIPIRVGIGDEDPGMFGQVAFQRLHVKRVRFFIPWNAIGNPTALSAATAFVEQARAHHIQVLLHLSTDNYASKQAHLPSVAQYRSEVRRLVPYFRRLGVREFGTWNEVNHASEPTYRSPTRAAEFFKELYRTVKGACRSCTVIALDVLDQAGVTRYMRSFYRALSPTWRRRASIVGIHNYSDVNRQRTSGTAGIIRQAHAFNPRTHFWLTETGGLVKFGRSFPCNQTRASHRLRTMFSIADHFRRSGIDRIYIFSWTGAGCSARFDAGLTNPDGSVRPGYLYVRSKLPSYLR